MARTNKLDDRYRAAGNDVLKPFENSFQNCPRVIGITGDSEVEVSKVVSSLPRERNFNTLEINPKETLAQKIRETTINVRLVHGTDDREQVIKTTYPYNTICLLQIKFGFQDGPVQGTGFFISKRCILTAGHCVYYQGEWAASITISPGALGNIEPFGHSFGSRFRSVEGWTTDRNSNFDYGAIILENEDLFNRINATMGLMASANESMVEIAGYPDDKAAKMPYTAKGPVNSRSKFRFFYNVDTEGGNSGSPVFIKDPSGIFAVGIHTDGDNPDNYGIRLRQEMMDRLHEWMQL